MGESSRLCPKLAKRVELQSVGLGRVIVSHHRRGPLLVFDEDEALVLRHMDGEHSVGELEEMLRDGRGAFAHHDLVLLLFRLWDQGLLAESEPVRDALFPEHRSRTVDRERVWKQLREIASVPLMADALGPPVARVLARVEPAINSKPAVVLSLMLAVLPLILLVAGVFEPPEILFRHGDSWVRGIALVYGCAAFVLSCRGLAHGAILAGTEHGIAQAGLRALLGVLHLDVDDRVAAYLPRNVRLRLGFAGLAAIALVAGSASIAASLGVEWAATLAVSAFLIGMVDLCPFLPTDGAILIETIAGIDRQSSRIGAYVTRRSVRDLTARTPTTHAFPVVATVWILWFFSAMEVFHRFFVKDVLALQSAVFSGGSVPLIVVGGLFVSYVALVIVVTIMALVFVGASLVVQAMTPDRVSAPRAERSGNELDEPRRAKLAERIAALPFAGEIPESVRRALVERLVELDFPKMAWIQRTGRDDHRFYWIVDGAVEVLRARTEGGHELVATLGPGDCFGEEGLAGHPAHHDVRAKSACRIVALDGHVFRELMKTAGADEEAALRIVGVAEFLDVVPELSGLGPAGRLELATAVAERHFDAGEAIIREGDAATAMYIVREGRCRVHREERTVAELGPGATFGEIGLVHRVPRTATVSAAEPTVVYEIPAAALERSLDRAFHVGLALERLAASRVRG